MSSRIAAFLHYNSGMGYDRTRFLGKVDDEFICAICVAVIDNPVQTPCEHLFCTECIKDWINLHETCPVDQRSLTTNDLGDPNRVLRNMLNKLDIKCDFEQDGCKAITEFEFLRQHVNKCVYNMDAEVECDKECNMTMTRREYLEHSCVTYLAKEVTKLRCHFERTLDSHAKENKKLRHELSEQKYNFERTLDSQAKENRKFRDEIDRQRREHVEFCADISLNEPQEWQFRHKICILYSGILAKTANYVACVQSARALRPTKSGFEIHINDNVETDDYFYVGLTRRGFFGSFRESNPFSEFCTNSCSHISYKCSFKSGDVVECGIEFPKDFIFDDKHSAQFYVSVNQEIKFKETRAIPKDGYFPSIFFDHYKSSLMIKYRQK